MKKVVIVGSPGSGKTEFAERLGSILKIHNIYHLDKYFWKPGWIKTTKEERLEILREITSYDSWIMEGNFSNTVDYQLAVAASVIYLNLPRHVCLWRVIKRRFSYMGRNMPEIAPGCPDKISYEFLKSIWIYPSTDGKLLREKLQTQGHRLQVIILNSRAEITRFLSQTM